MSSLHSPAHHRHATLLPQSLLRRIGIPDAHGSGRPQPQAETPGCTKEACKFRDEYEAFKKAGAEVIGISGDPVAAQKAFASKYGLPFTILSDEGDGLRKALGVPGDMFGMLPGRQTYVISKQGKVALIFNSQLDVEAHVTKALDALAKL